MPVQYTDGIRAEHEAVRTRAGVFDVSHMGEVQTSGPDAEAFLQHVLSNDVAKMAVGGAQYSMLCNEDGGLLDDLFTYRLGRRPLPDRHERRQPRRRLRLDARPGRAATTCRSRTSPADYAMLAVQGPRAREIVEQIADSPLPPRMQAARRIILGHETLVCGTGYTGEDGVELLLAPDRRGRRLGGAAAPRRRALRPRRARHAAPGGLLSALRQRPLDRSQPDRGRPRLGGQGGHGLHRLRGRSAAPAQRAPAEKLVAFKITGPGIARQGNPVVGGGEVTSGTMSPSLGVGIGMAYVPAERAAVGETLEIDVRGKVRTRGRRTQAPLHQGDRWLKRAIPTSCSTTPSTTGRASRTASRPSGSRGLRRTRSARSSSSTRPRSDRRSPPVSSTPRSSPSRPSRRSSRRCRARSSRSTPRWPTTPSRSTRIPTARAGW